ncbi:hypothetical protein CEXT_21541 [Caerostris extrusa]|uniref:Uncharacterized protein n=1 Tax=Caerostris extrusa TaxID=172846 RepID=A0AAV4S0U1_CAEEX|nr:hypothetical protein CEXT_21541 [Caerostris extrusa]
MAGETAVDEANPSSAPLSKKALKKQAKDEEKAMKKQKAKQAEVDSKQEEEDYSKDSYGKMIMIQSQEKIIRNLVPVKLLEKDLGEEKIWVRGRLHTSRAKASPENL